MILYHGTPLESGEKIIKEGKIQCQIQRSHEGYKNIIEGTTDGYVYLTQTYRRHIIMETFLFWIRMIGIKIMFIYLK